MTGSRQQVFLLGSERSGSNLLRTLIGNHSEVSAPIAPHLCDVFYANFSHYCPLNDSRRKELLLDIEKYVNHTFNDWNIKFEIDRMIMEYTLDSFIDFVNAAYSEKANSDGCLTYFSKDNHNHKYALGILKSVPSARFIYLYRDPRDQVASWMRTPVHLHTPYKAIKKWNREQLDCLLLNQFYGLDMHFVRYEDLVDDSERIMKGILDYLHLPQEEQCFSTNKDNKEADKHPLWENIAKPVIKNNYGKYKDVLNGRNLEMVETIAKISMSKLGYKPETNSNWKVSSKLLFRVKEKVTDLSSRRRYKDFANKEMEILKDKRKLINSLFSKFN